MIYGPTSDVFRDYDGKLTFTADPLLWQNYLPEVGFFQAQAIDPAMGWGWFDDAGVDIGKMVNGGNASGAAAMLMELAGRNVTTAIREATGMIATTVGFLQGMQGTLSRLYEDPLTQIADSLDFFAEIVNSEAFQQALNGLTMIPIIGWILRVVGEIIRLIADISAAVAAKAQQAMDDELGRRFYLPMFGPAEKRAYETAEMQSLLKALGNYDATRVFRPRYVATSAADFQARRARYEGTTYTWKDSKGDSHTTPVQDAFYITTQNAGGGGFMPGSSSLMTTLEIRTGGCGTGWIRNLGSFLASVQTTAGYVWQTLISEGPALFAVDTGSQGRLARDWENTTRSWITFALESMSTGWTCSETANQPIWNSSKGKWEGGDWEYCGPWNKGLDRCKKTRHYGRKLDLNPDISHASEMITWLMRSYWGTGPNQDSFPLEVRNTNYPGHPADAFYYENSVAAVAIQNLRDRQFAKLHSLDAFYVHPEDADGETVPRFPTLANDPDLKQRWENAVTAMLNQGDDWKRVHMPDVPIESPLRPILLGLGLPENPGPGSGPVGGMSIAHPSILGDPKPPRPPEQAGMMELLPLPGGGEGGGKKKSKKTKKSETVEKVAKVAAAGSAVALAGLAYHRSRRKYFTQGTGAGG